MRLCHGAHSCGSNNTGRISVLEYVAYFDFANINTTNVSGSTFLCGSTFAVTVNNSCVFGSSAIVRA